jgi:acetolactate synthase-1/2/3 large subunit
MSSERHGGHLVAEVLVAHGVRHLFALCGGHISPILVGAKDRGIAVIDTRHEAAAVFAADAMARLTGIPGAAAVTAGPGATNAVTAIKNARIAQSPVLVLGGAAATLLAGRGALQDIDQMALLRPHVKWATRVGRVRDLAPTVERALITASTGVPGPVFVEVPIDLLYGEDTVRAMYRDMSPKARRPGALALRGYMRLHAWGLFRGSRRTTPPPPAPTLPAAPDPADIERAAAILRRAERPVLLVGSPAVVDAGNVTDVAAAVAQLGVPVYLSGMARGLLGAGHPLVRRHHRRRALRQADAVVLAGVVADFRLDYGRQIPRGTPLVAVNRSRDDLTKNRKPTVAVLGDPGRFLAALSEHWGRHPNWDDWLAALGGADARREREISDIATADVGGVNPVRLLQQIDDAIADDSIIVADGGDFVGTASYILSPRRPLSWLDPGPFGTLGVGGGFAAAAKLARPEAEVWLLYGDGSAAYSLAEFDTFVRHGLGVIAVVGNDASWSQIAREQVDLLGDDVGTVLRSTDYHTVAEGYGGKGFVVEHQSEVAVALAAAKEAAAAGTPALINARIGMTDFRKGSISI